jgi:UDP-N-acetylglucosamine 2-epimerase (non-hydrolysing)
MGEAPATVFNVGAIGLDHVMRSRRMSLHALASNLGFPLRLPFFLVTYHPVTLGDEDPRKTFDNLLTALDRFLRHQIILTYPNADDGGRAIIPRINEYAHAQPERVHAIPSLGFERYLSALAQAAAVIGNSSSGIIEAPSFMVPSVNIGVRQSGRLSAESVIHCGTHPDEIGNAISYALSAEFAKPSTRFTNPYGQGDAAKSIVKVMESTRPPLQKHFFDAC